LIKISRYLESTPCVIVAQIPPQRLCREIVTWKYLSHPNILSLLGVSVSRDPLCFLILSKWMPNGNVMQYARSNPGANRLRLVGPPAFRRDVPSRSSITLSSLRSCLGWPTSTNLRSFMGISKEQVQLPRCTFHLADG